MIQFRLVGAAALFSLACTSLPQVLKPGWMKTNVENVAFSRNGKLAMSLRPRDHNVTETLFWDVATKKPLLLIANPGSAPYEPRHDGKGMFYCTVENNYAGKLWSYDIATRKGTPVFTLPAYNEIVDVAVSKTGSKIAVLTAFWNVFVFDTATSTLTSFNIGSKNDYQLEFADYDRKIVTSGLQLYTLDGTLVRSQIHTYVRGFRVDNNGRFIYTEEPGGSPYTTHAFRGANLTHAWSAPSYGDGAPLPVGGQDSVISTFLNPYPDGGTYIRGELQASSGAFQDYIGHPFYYWIGSSTTEPKVWWRDGVSLLQRNMATGSDEVVMDNQGVWWGGWGVYSHAGRNYVEDAGPVNRWAYDAQTGARHMIAVYAQEGKMSPDGTAYARYNPLDGTTAITEVRWNEAGEPYDFPLTSAGPARGGTPIWDGNEHLMRQAGEFADCFSYIDGNLSYRGAVQVNPGDYALPFGEGKYVGYREEPYGYGAPRLIVKRVSDGAQVAMIEKEGGLGISWKPLDGDRFATLEWTLLTDDCRLTIKTYDLSTGIAVQTGVCEYLQPRSKGIYGIADIASDGSYAVVMSNYGATNPDATNASRIAYVRLSDGRVLRTYDDQFIGVNGAYPIIFADHRGFAWRTIPDSNHGYAQFVVEDAPAILMNVKLKEGTLHVGGSLSARVEINRPAPTGGVLVRLAAGDGSVASVPSSIVVPEGESGASFTVTAVATTRRTVNIRASYDGAVLRTPVTVGP